MRQNDFSDFLQKIGSLVPGAILSGEWGRVTCLVRPCIGAIQAKGNLYRIEATAPYRVRILETLGV